MSDTFCILAFNHLQIEPNGNVKMCCIASEDVVASGRVMSLYTDTYENIWNSDYMREARRRMAAGQKTSACGRCYYDEATLGKSRRTEQNENWLDSKSTSLAAILDQARRNDWKVEARPEFLQLNMGNLCNLACRMCSGLYSSRIASDPVHSKWTPDTYLDIARWQGDQLHFAPRPFFGVQYEGFYGYEISGSSSWRWTNGSGRLTIPIPSEADILALNIAIQCREGTTSLIVKLNGEEKFRGPVSGSGVLKIERNFGAAAKAEIELLSDTIVFGDRQYGIAVTDAWLDRSPSPDGSASRSHAFTRFSGDKGWWANKEIMFGEILSEIDRLKHVILQGGEPLLNKEFDDILDRLIEAGAAPYVTFEIVSNLTVLKQSTLDKLAQLKHVELGASIDGLGPYLDYIRYPANWTEVQNNLARVRILPNVSILFNIAVQAYNLLHVADILHYCDENGIDAHTHFLIGPPFLNVLILPIRARQEAAARLRSYLSGKRCRDKNTGCAHSMLIFLAEHEHAHNRDYFERFVKFTNDLDKSRQQSFGTLFADHVQWFEELGLRWTADHVFAAESAL